ncbi:hypothetical protein HW555_013736, partial [Spodoptera exigua]
MNKSLYYLPKYTSLQCINNSTAPRLLYGGIYKHLNETMKLLWTADLKMNTVHVRDVCRAVWTLGRHPEANKQIYNVVDDANSTQGALAELVSDIFKIQHDYYGTAISTLAKYNGISNNYGRILDLVLSNDTVTVSECQDPLVTIDPHHNALNIDVCFFQVTYLKSELCIKYIYRKGDYNKINKEISEINWYDEFKHKSIESAVNCFYSNLNAIINRNIPSKTCKNDTYPIWYTAALKKVLKEKHKFLKKFKTYGNLSDKATFELLRERVKRLESECYLKHIKMVESSIRTDPKYFWKFVKSRSNTSNIPSSLTYGNKIADEGTDICNLFSDYFYSTFLPSSQTLFYPDFDSCDKTATDIASVAEEANDKHLTAWAELCSKYGLQHTPLEPSAGHELLLNKQLCLDGRKLRAILQLDVPAPTIDKLR